MFPRNHNAWFWGIVTPTKVVGTTKTYHLDLMVGELGLCPGLRLKIQGPSFVGLLTPRSPGIKKAYLATGALWALASGGGYDHNINYALLGTCVVSDDAARMILFPMAILVIGYFVLPDAIVDMLIDIFIAVFKAMLGFEDDGSLDYLFQEEG